MIYSKTGSPILDKPVPSATGEALEKLVQKGRLFWSAGRFGVRLEKGGDTLWAARRAAGRAAYEQAFARALGEIGYGRAQWVRSALLERGRPFGRGLRPRGRAKTTPDDYDPPLELDGAGLKVNRDSEPLPQPVGQEPGRALRLLPAEAARRSRPAADPGGDRRPARQDDQRGDPPRSRRRQRRRGGPGPQAAAGAEGPAGRRAERQVRTRLPNTCFECLGLPAEGGGTRLFRSSPRRRPGPVPQSPAFAPAPPPGNELPVYATFSRCATIGSRSASRSD